jgi:hypothetical protein
MHNHILQYEVRDSLQPGGPGLRIYIPQEQGGPVLSPGTEFLFAASYDSLGYGGGTYSTPPPQSQSQSYVTIDGSVG